MRRLFGAQLATNAVLAAAFAQCFAMDESSVPPSQQRYRAALLAAPSLLPCLTITASIAYYALLLPQLPLVTPVTGVGPGSLQAAAADSTAGSSSSSSSSSSSKIKRRKGESGSSAKGKSGSSGTANSASTAAGSGSVSWPECVQVAYRERQRLPAMQQKLLRLFGCSSTAVLCAAAYAKEDLAGTLGQKDSTVWFLARQIGACSLFEKYCVAILQPAFEDNSTQSAVAAAVGTAQQQQQQQVYFLLPSLLLYWCAYRPAELADQSDRLVPIAIARRCAMTVQVLAQQQGRWLLPMELRKAAVDELPPLFSRVGQILLQPAGTSKTAPGGASSSSVANLCADDVMSLVSCMCKMYAGISSGSIDGAISSNESVGLGPQHAGGVHQLLEYAVRSQSVKAVPQLPEVLHMLLRSGSVWRETAVAGAIASLSSHGSSSSSSSSTAAGSSSSSSGGNDEHLQCISLVFSVMKCISLQFAAASAAQLAGSTAQHNAPSSNEYGVPHSAVQIPASQCCRLLASGAASWLQDFADAFTAAAAPGAAGAAGAAAEAARVTAAVPWPVLIGRVLLQVEFAAAHDQHVVYHTVLAALRGFLQVQGVAEHMAAAGLDTTQIVQQVSAVWVTEEADVLPAAWRSLGVSLTSLAFQYACNNPTCSNLSGPQELQLVNGRSCMCGGCRVAHYCSRACQRQHWKAHKAVCQAIAAAQAAKTESEAAESAAAQAGS
jgi:hypothetical protein